MQLNAHFYLIKLWYVVSCVRPTTTLLYVYNVQSVRVIDAIWTGHSFHLTCAKARRVISNTDGLISAMGADSVAFCPLTGSMRHHGYAANSSSHNNTLDTRDVIFKTCCLRTQINGTLCSLRLHCKKVLLRMWVDRFRSSGKFLMSSKPWENVRHVDLLVRKAR